MDIHGKSISEIHQLSLSELKKLGKICKLYKYHTRSKEELLYILSFETLPFDEKFKKVSKKQIVQFAKEQGVKINLNAKVSEIKEQLKERYIHVLYPETVSQQEDQNDKNTKEHYTPKKYDTE